MDIGGQNSQAGFSHAGKTSPFVSRFPSPSPSPIPDFLTLRLMHLGWLEEYMFNQSRGYMLRWSAYGVVRARKLCALIQARGLEADGKAKMFTVQCQSMKSSPSTDQLDADCSLWISALEDLQLINEETTLQVFCRLITTINKEERHKA